MTNIANIKVLGIETSCDETAAAIVDGEGNILSDVILSQFSEHEAFGGVVPEIAARAHANHLDEVIKTALSNAKTNLTDISAIAVTAGPGLIGGVMVGVVTAKALALATDKPLFGINHLEGHALTTRLTDQTAFPYLLLLISGGHCQLIEVRGLGNYSRLGTTIDDAAGEAFDKTAKLLDLGVPGGPAVEKMAKNGNAERFKLPRPLIKQDNCDFSFSGLKTAVKREAEAILSSKGEISIEDKADLCASFQTAIADSLSIKSQRAMKLFQSRNKNIENPTFVVAGGVAANTHIRHELEELSAEHGFSFNAPPPKLCTDNGAMIAWVGVEKLQAGENGNSDFIARPRWPLDSVAEAKLGFGKKGAKA